MSRVLVGAGGHVGEEVQVEQGAHGPARFWRGQGRYVVGEVLAPHNVTVTASGTEVSTFESIAAVTVLLEPSA